MKTKLYIDNKQIKDVKIAVAITPKEQQMGLMYVVEPKSYAMIFPYKTAGIRKFWMENTYIPLDIVFCKDNVIVDIKYGQPLCKDHIGPNTKTDLVIEFPYGYCLQNNIKIGSNVMIKYDNSKLRQLLFSSNESAG